MFSTSQTELFVYLFAGCALFFRLFVS